MNDKNKWKLDLLSRMPKWELRDGVVLSPEPIMIETGYGKIDYESILKDPFRTVSAENRFYIKLINKSLEKINFQKNTRIVDLGCGDGRFVLHFLKSGFRRIVGLDLSIHNLRLLSKRLEKMQQATEKILLVEGDICKPPLPESYFDLVISIGVLSTLNERYCEGIRSCAKLAKKGGFVLTIDPTEFGAAMYAIVRHDLNELEKVILTRTKTVDIENPNATRYGVRSVEEMKEAHKTNGLKIVSISGIPLFPSLLFGAVKQMGTYSNDELVQMKKLNNLLIERFPTCWRALCIIAQRKD